MHRFITPILLTLTLAACGHVEPPAPVPPKAAIVALATPPGMPTAPHASTITKHSHPHWSLEIPTAWTVDKDTDQGLDAKSDVPFGRVPMLVMLLTAPVTDGTAPEKFALVMSLMAPSMVPDGLTVIGEQHDQITFMNRPASIAELHTDKGITVAQLAVLQPEASVGYVFVCVNDGLVKGNDKLCADIVKTLTLQ